jgi:hypothetical protein
VKPYAATPEQVDRFRAEREAFRLAYRCPDCLHVTLDGRRCILEYPNRTLMESEAYLEEGGQFVFCKYFEPA